jgi:hypothetical protein
MAGCGGTAAAPTTQQASLARHSNNVSAAQLALRQQRRIEAHHAARARLISAQRRAAADQAANSLASYDTSSFGVSYPSTWSATTTASPGYHDTTIRSADGLHLVRVDVQDVAPNSDPEVLATPVEKGLESQPGYRLLGWGPSSLGAYDALRWEFVVNENGVLLRKVDTFFVDNDGAGIAILVQAPAAGYQYWQPVFKQIRQSLAVNDSAPATEPATPPAAAIPQPAPSGSSFCDTHACIPNFDNGNGYPVECADGMWSDSGGVQGACSGHGGELGNSSEGTSGYPTPSSPTIGAGSGYAVGCADGSISNSGGIQGACSHHGGVSP